MFKAQIIHDLACAINAIEGTHCIDEYVKEQVAQRDRLQEHMVSVATQLWKGTHGNKPVSIKALTLALQAAGWEESVFHTPNGRTLELIVR